MRLFLVVALTLTPYFHSSVFGDEAQVHTMKDLLQIASQREREIRTTVKDYTCLIVKRERIDGKLQETRFIEAKVRPEAERDGRTMPLAVRLTFRAPRAVVGRTVLFVEGENDGKMIVKRGGRRLSNVTVKVDPDSEIARNETLMQISHLGFDGMVGELVSQIQKDMAADPNGTNTVLNVKPEAKINKRPCTAVEIIHPQREKGLLYHKAQFFIDNEFHLPMRVAAYDWPKTDGAQPKLMAEFTYTKVKINVGLTDADFDPEILKTAARP
ncbi:MAG: DUF1571 domain-containing protein [Planctomycetaceae bacterium]|nr:DUF1571 domain-containing protein [Planctomycetaceae bacterium]